VQRVLAIASAAAEGRNSELCVAVDAVARTAGMLALGIFEVLPPVFSNNFRTITTATTNNDI